MRAEYGSLSTFTSERRFSSIPLVVCGIDAKSILQVTNIPSESLCYESFGTRDVEVAMYRSRSLSLIC